jgi:GTP cyclohydrolase II
LFSSSSYRLSSFIDSLRDKGWTIVNHDEVAITRGSVSRKAKFTRYELFATLTPELLSRVKSFCNDVDAFESEGRTPEKTKK